MAATQPNEGGPLLSWRKENGCSYCIALNLENAPLIRVRIVTSTLDWSLEQLINGRALTFSVTVVGLVCLSDNSTIDSEG